jgi:hypothetical protein
MNLDHDVLKADLAAAETQLGVEIRSEQQAGSNGNGRPLRGRLLEVKLPVRSPICARFVREGLVERAKKLFVDEVEVGSSWFDDHVYVVTSTREATAAFLQDQRVQQALILLVDPSRHVEIDHDSVRVIDDDAQDDGRDASAELLALVAHLV